MANGQNIDYSEKENGPRASSAPALGLNTIIFKHVYWYMLQISGERLQDHWSSGLHVTIVNSESAFFRGRAILQDGVCKGTVSNEVVFWHFKPTQWHTILEKK